MIPPGPLNNRVKPGISSAIYWEVLFWTEYNSRSDDLSSDTFKYYPKLRVLKLSKDVLVKFPSDIFSPLTKLTDLDLSENSLTQIPCNLPSSLVNLNLNENPISDETGCGRDCLSPPDSLENLSLHNSNKGVFRRKKFPRFCESVPSIKYLDISASSLDSISSEDVAPLCGLQRINLTSVTVSHSNGTCQKLQFEKWLGDRKIEMIGSITAAKHDPNANCSFAPTNEAEEIYRNCTYKLHYQKFGLISIVVCILLLACILAAILWRRKRKRSTKKLDLENSSNAMVTIENRGSDGKTDEN
ncbi:hypothetical protein V9T40_010454 [Parthenolecanium corni]|uniref:Uncharacterized protein n=1 Tax=Parthenolecanium corni TaxID=536013 RepID=A0AAN9T8Z7_9HEMI